MIANVNKPKLRIERIPAYISPSALGAYEGMPNSFFAEKCIEDKLPRSDAGLAASVGTAFDIAVKMKLLEQGVPLCAGATREDILRSLEENENVDEARKLGRQILQRYEMSGTLREHPNLPIPRVFKQVEGVIRYSIAGVPILCKLDAIVLDPYTKKLAPFDWKVIGGAAKAGVSPKQGYAGSCDAGQWAGAHKLYTQYENASSESGYNGVQLPIEEIDKAFATQFTMYAWATKSMEMGTDTVSTAFAPLPVHFDSAVFNGKNRTIKIYSYRAIASVEWQEKVLQRLRHMWNDLTEQGGASLLNRLESKINLKIVKEKAKNESWF